MAGTTGALYGSEFHGIRLEFHWSRTAVSTINNQSTIYWEVRVRCTSSIKFSAPKKWSCTVNGTSYSGTYSNGMNGTGTTSSPLVQTVASGQTIITHNSNGQKSFAVSVTFGILITITSTGEALNNIIVEGSDTLTPIPRVSTITASNGKLGTAQTLTVTRQDTSFTHTVTYKCGSASGTLVTKSTNTSISWTPSLDLAKQNTTGTSVSVVFTITTYTGSTSLGTSTKTISCTMPSSIKPSTPTISVSDGKGYYSTYSAYVQSKSTFSVSISSSGSYGSTISSYSSSANGSTYTTASFTTAVIKSSGTLTISVTVTDSRGRTASNSVTVTVLPYSSPAVSALKAIRCTSTGTASSSGAYLKVIFSAKVSSLNSKNTATYTLSYKKKSATSYTNVTLTSYSNTYTVSNGSYIFEADTSTTYDIKVVAKDNFSNISRVTDGAATIKVLSILKNGLGLAIGKVVELSEYFDVGWNAVFRKNVEIKGDLIANVATTKQWTAVTTVGAWSRICSFSGGYRNLLLSVKMSQSEQVTICTYVIGIGYSSATINQLAGSGYAHNYTLQLRVVFVSGSSTAGYIEVYNDYGYNSATTVNLACQITALTKGATFPTLYTAYTASDDTTSVKATYTSKANGIGTSGGISTQGSIITDDSLQTYTGVEVFNTTPYVDFHYNNSTDDYTARIVESESGVLKVYNSITNASDSRLKKELESPFGDLLDTYLELYDKLEPTLYRYTKGDDYLNVGLIAQEVLALEKELGIEHSLLVRGTGKEIQVNGKTEIDYYSIDYTAISVLGLIKNRQMNEICNSLTNNLIELKSELDSIGLKVSKIETQLSV